MNLFVLVRLTLTELTFLLELLLNHKLPKPTKTVITERIKEVEAQLTTLQIHSAPIVNTVEMRGVPMRDVPAHLANQSPSTIAAMMRHPDLVAQIAPPEPTQPVVIAQTPQAQMAMNARQEAISLAISGKPEKGRTSPRKF